MPQQYQKNNVIEITSRNEKNNFIEKLVYW